jgi:nucleotide-binding universal stress UspA family protein
MQTLLLPYHDDAVCDAALAAACLTAQRFNSHVEALYVREVPQIIVSEIIPAAYVTQINDQTGRSAETARAHFARGLEPFGLRMAELDGPAHAPTAGWREATGRESEIVGDYGRLFDLIVVARSDRPNAAGWRETAEAALFDSGRPVLVASAVAPRVLGENIVIAWNCSTETARTVAFGMPYLKQAKQVVVLTVEGGTVPGPTGEEVAQHLRRNAIPATARTAAANGRSIGQAMLAEALALGADLMFKGAYTQSRLRQMIFGGATDHILTAATLPVFFAH